MCRAHEFTAALAALTLTTLTLGCSLDGGGGASDAQVAGGGAATGGGSGPAGGDTGGADRAGGHDGNGGIPPPEGGHDGTGGLPGAPPSFDDGDAVVAYLIQLVAACPPLSRSTVPGGWDVHALKDAACSVWTPPGWLESEDVATKSFLADAEGTTGYLTIATQVPGTNWTIETLTQTVTDNLKEQTPDLEILAARTDPDPYGLGYQIRNVVLKYKKNGRPTVATLTMVHTECSAILNTCPLTGMGSWSPLDELATWACVLRQVDASVYCPGGGGSEDCVDSACNAQCIDEGNEGGGCQGDRCVCR